LPTTNPASAIDCQSSGSWASQTLFTKNVALTCSRRRIETIVRPFVALQPSSNVSATTFFAAEPRWTTRGARPSSGPVLAEVGLGVACGAGLETTTTPGAGELPTLATGPFSPPVSMPLRSDVMALAATAPVASTTAIGSASSRRACRLRVRSGEAGVRANTRNPRSILGRRRRWRSQGTMDEASSPVCNGTP